MMEPDCTEFSGSHRNGPDAEEARSPAGTVHAVKGPSARISGERSDQPVSASLTWTW